MHALPPRSALRSSLAAFLLLAAQPAWSVCNAIPGATGVHRGAVGALNRPFASPGELVGVEVNPAICERLPNDVPGPAINSDATESVVSVLFTPPAGPAHAAIVAADCAQIAAEVAACDLALQAGGGGAVCKTAGPDQLLVVDEPTKVGVARRRLFFPFPDTDGDFGLASDGRTLSGPAKIVVTPLGTALPCQIAAAPAQRCADVERTLGEIACVDELYALDGTCDQGPGDVDPTFGHFTALPIPNDYAALCNPGSDPDCAGADQELRFTTDAAGHAYLPWDYSGILKDPGADGIPIARIGRGLTSVAATSGGSPLSLPSKGFLTSHAPEGFLLPPLFTPLPDADPGATTLFGSIDAERGVMRFARQSPTGFVCVGGSFPGSACEPASEASDCGVGACAAGAPDVFDFQDRYADAGVGPVVVASSDYSIQAETSVQLSGIRETGEVLSLVVDEAVEQQDLNGDADMTDFVVTLASPSDGSPQPVGTAGSPGLGVTRELTPSGVVPIVAAEGDRVAFFVSEPREQLDLNQDADADDAILMAFQQGSSVELTSGQDVTQGPLAPFPITATSDTGGLTGPSILLNDGLVFLGTAEVTGATPSTRRLSTELNGDAPPFGSFDGQATRDLRHVAATSFLNSVPSGFLGGVYVWDRDTDGDGVFDEPGFTSIAAVGLSATDMPIMTATNGLWPDLNDGTDVIPAARFVAFATDSPDLVPGDTNGIADVFVRDRDVDGDGIFDEPAPDSTTVRVSVASDGSEAAQLVCPGIIDGSFDPQITPDGRFVLFYSTAINLVPGDTNDSCAFGRVGQDVFVHDRDTDEDGIYDEPGAIKTVRVSVDDDGVQGVLGLNWTSVLFPRFGADPPARIRLRSISDDGRIVAFDSSLDLDLTQPVHATSAFQPCVETFVHDRDADGNGVFDEPGGISTRVLAPPIGIPNPTWTCPLPPAVPNFANVTSMTPDGSYIAFQSDFDDLVPGDTNGVLDAFVHERATGKVTRVSVDARGRQANGASIAPFFLDDRGDVVTFQSAATNLMDDDQDRGGAFAIFVRFLPSGLVARGIAAGIAPVTAAQVTPAGSILTSPTAFDAGDTNASDDVFTTGFDAVADAERDFNGDGRLGTNGYVQIVDIRSSPSPTVAFPATDAFAAGPEGSSAWLWPETNAGLPLNDDGDALDLIMAFHEGRDPFGDLALDAVFPESTGGTPLAADQVTVSTAVVAGTVVEADQGDGSLNGDGDTDDRVAHVCDRATSPPVCRSTGRATQGSIQAIEPAGGFARPWALAFLVTEAGDGSGPLNGDGDSNDDVLFLATNENPPQVVNTGFAAKDFVVGESFVAFRVPEAGQGVGSLNADGDTLDAVLHVVDLTKDPEVDPSAFISSDSSAVLCELDVCDPTVPYRVKGQTVRFLTREPDEQRDLNGDLDQTDLVVQLLNLAASAAARVQVVSVVEEIPPENEALGLGLDPLAEPPFDGEDDNSQVLLTRGICRADTGQACSPGMPCSPGEVCSAGTCQRGGSTCSSNQDCLAGSGEVCVPEVAAVGATNSDDDEIPDALDNCPAVANADQADLDDDGVGDACDAETCGDGQVTGSEECDDGNLQNGDDCSRFCRVAGCVGDVNLDGRVDQTDDDQFDDTAGCFTCSSNCNETCDLNEDGLVNSADSLTLKAELGLFCSGAPIGGGGGGLAAVPSCGLGPTLAPAMAVLVGLRRRRKPGRAPA